MLALGGRAHVHRKGRARQGSGTSWRHKHLSCSGQLIQAHQHNVLLPLAQHR